MAQGLSASYHARPLPVAVGRSGQHLRKSGSSLRTGPPVLVADFGYEDVGFSIQGAIDSCSGRSLDNHTADGPEHLSHPLQTDEYPTIIQAVQHNRFDELQAQIRGGTDIEVRDDRLGMTPLNWACRTGQLALVKLLVDHKADVEAGDCQLRLPLHRAASGGYADIVAYLLAHGAAPDGRDSTLRTPLHRAARWGWPECVRLLLDAGADMEAEDRQFARTPLHYACRAGGLDTITLLLARGANVDKRTVVGNTALHLACDRGLVDNVRLLLEWGANPVAKNDLGKTPAEVIGMWVDDDKKNAIQRLLASSPHIPEDRQVMLRQRQEQQAAAEARTLAEPAPNHPAQQPPQLGTASVDSGLDPAAIACELATAGSQSLSDSPGPTHLVSEPLPGQGTPSKAVAEVDGGVAMMQNGLTRGTDAPSFDWSGGGEDLPSSAHAGRTATRSQGCCIIQ